MIRRPSDPDVREVRRDLDKALGFAHEMAMETAAEVLRVVAIAQALIDELTEQKLIDPATLTKRIAERKDQAMEAASKRLYVETHADAEDKYAARDLPDVPCAELMPICKARCCTLKVSLTKQDVKERIMALDYGNPYHLERLEDGYCAHSDRETHGCTIYANRPMVCRRYDCRKDPRIWADYENRILAQ
jgi:Fe-S-cluster containining protein